MTFYCPGSGPTSYVTMNVKALIMENYTIDVSDAPPPSVTYHFSNTGYHRSVASIAGYHFGVVETGAKITLGGGILMFSSPTNDNADKLSFLTINLQTLELGRVMIRNNGLYGSVTFQCEKWWKTNG